MKSSDSIHEPSDGASRPEQIDRAGLLTDEQKAFATVAGQALAEAWRRKWRKVADEPHLSSAQDAQPSTRTL